MSVWLWILFLVVAVAVYAWATGVTLFKVRDGVATPTNLARAELWTMLCLVWLQVAYFLYTRTFLGQVIHNRTLKKYRGQPAHTVSTHVDCGKLCAPHAQAYTKALARCRASLTSTCSLQPGQFTVTVVPYNQDNYGYVLMDKATKWVLLLLAMLMTML